MTATERRHRFIAEFAGESHQHEITPWSRLAPAICTVVILLGVWIGTSTLFWCLVPLALIGAAGGRHPIDVIYSEIIAPMLGQRPLPRCGAPRRFSCSIAAVWLMAIATAFQDGPTLLGGLLAGLLAAAMFMTATLDVCLPCYTYARLFAPPRARRTTAEEPTIVR